MKVLQINSVCGNGSTGRLVVQISNYLDQCGVENAIAYGFGASARPNAFRFGNGLDAHLHSFLSRKLCWQGKASHVSTYRLLSYMNRFRPDIVHLHNIHGHYLNYKMLFQYLKQKNCEVVWTFHDCWPITGKCAHFTEVQCQKWKTGCFDCPQLNRYPDSVRDRSRKNYWEKKNAFTSLHDLHIVTVSHWLESIVRESFLGGQDIRCIYNGVDTHLFSPQISSIRQKHHLQGKFVILSAASVWNHQKGLDRFLALSRVLKDDEAIVLIGVTPVQKEDLPENVIGIPVIHRQTVLAQWYTAADVYLSFSMEETFGLTVAEAMACGTPAVVMDSTACPEVLGKNTGFAVDLQNTDTVLSALRQIKANGKDAYSPSCQARIADSFSLEAMQQAYLKLYQSIRSQHEPV